MSSAVVAQSVGAVTAAAGVVIFLSPGPRRVPAAGRRAAGLGLMAVAWVTLLASLASAEDLSAARSALLSPRGAVGALLALAVLALGGWLGGRTVRRWPAVWFVLLGLSLPFRVPVSLGSQEANLLVPLYAVIALGIGLWLLEWARGRRELAGATPVDLPLGLFVGFLMLSTLWSADPSEAAVKAVFFYLPFVVLFRLVIVFWHRADALRALGVTTVALAVPIAAFAVVQYATQSGIYWNETLQQANVYSRLFRVNSVFFDPNILGRYLVIAILAAVAMAWLARGPRVLATLVGAIAVMSAGLWVTFSRSAALGLGVGLALLAWRAFGPRRTLAVGAILVALLATAALAGNENVRRAATSTERLDVVSEGRFDLVEGGLTIWRQDPVVGAGLGGFAQRFEDTLDQRELRRTRVVISHNAPITILSEGGLVGFALFLVLAITAAASIARGSRVRGPTGWAQWALLAMLASIAVHSLLYSALFDDPYTWVIAGAALVVGAGQRVTAVQEDAARGPEGADAALAT